LEQVAQGVRSAGVEPRIGATGQPGDFLESLTGGWVVTLMEHEDFHAKKPEFPGDRAKLVNRLLHRIADEDHDPDRRTARLAGDMPEHAADLRLAASAFDPGHQVR